MRIRAYQPGDQAACLAILRSNLERHFSPGDDVEFPRFLANLPGWYGVVELDNGPIGACGGIALDGAVAALTWGMVEAGRHGQGIGRFLLNERLRMVRD